MNEISIDDLKDSLSIEGARAAAAEQATKQKEVGKNDFLTMLVAQLENQDPLNPADSAEFASQLAQFSSLEQLVSMRESMDKLANAQTQDDLLTRHIEMTNLLGTEVSAYGDRIEVGAQGDVAIPFTLSAGADDLEVTILSGGHKVAVLRDMGRDQNGPILPRQGSNELIWDGRDSRGVRVAPGTYQFEVRALSGARELTAQPVVRGVVTGTRIEEGVPLLRLGNRSVRFEEVFEVEDRSSGNG